MSNPESNLSFQAWRADDTALSAEAAEALHSQCLTPDWQLAPVQAVYQLQRTYKFTNFVDALNLANIIGDLAEQYDHHPELTIAWGRLEVTWSTHKLGGLHQNDYFMAQRCDSLYTQCRV